MLADYYSHEYYEHICFNRRETSMTKEIVIEKGVPVPPKKAGRRGYQTAVFKQMQVGDSVVLEDKGRQNFIQYMRRRPP